MFSLMTWVSAAALCAAATATAAASTTAASAEDMVVLLRQGSIISTRQSAGEGRFYYAFNGIPFAKPPVKSLRFMAPVPADGWNNDIRNGSRVAPECPKVLNHPEEGTKVIGDEDCLYLNVFTPKPFPAFLPVIVYIHGGGFINGNMQDYQPLPLLTKDIVLVIIQYRLGILGFLSTEDSVLPGNMGMKDQTMALQWVRDNIRDLGGDPNRVTIMGESAGSLSVHFHTLSPRSKGLFQQAIIQSNVMNFPGTSFDDHRVVALKISEAVNCTSGEDVDTNELLSCLQDASVADLLSAPSVLDNWRGFTSVPRVDGDYLPESPASLLKKGRYNRVPMIIGYTKDEGISMAAEFLAHEDVAADLKENFTRIGPIALSFTSADDNPLYLSKRVFYHYLGVAEFPFDNIDGFTKMATDRYTKKSIYDAVDIYAQDSFYGDHVYLYELRHRANSSHTDLNQIDGLEDNWVAHGDDLQYLFYGIPPFNPLERGDDVFVGEIMISMWINFVTTGNPTPDMSLGFQWSPSTARNPQTLAITPSPYMIKDAFAENREFWRNLPTQTNKILYPERFQ